MSLIEQHRQDLGALALCEALEVPRASFYRHRRPRTPAAPAILDRFLHHAEIITITGRSYRLKDKAAKDSEQSKEQNKDEQDSNKGI